jgi:hypothetical protein
MFLEIVPASQPAVKPPAVRDCLILLHLVCCTFDYRLFCITYIEVMAKADRGVQAAMVHQIIFHAGD